MPHATHWAVFARRQSWVSRRRRDISVSSCTVDESEDVEVVGELFAVTDGGNVDLSGEAEVGAARASSMKLEML